MCAHVQPLVRVSVRKGGGPVWGERIRFAKPWRPLVHCITGSETMQSYLLFYLRFSWGASPTCDHGTAASRDYENFFFFFSNDAHRPNPFRPVERARGNRGVSEALESFQYSCSKLKTISIPRDSGSMLCLSPVERSRPNGSASPSTQRFFMVNREYILIAMRA